MDPTSLDAVSVILGALAAASAAGGAEGIKDLTKDAVTAGPRKLVKLIRERLSKRNDSLGDARLTIYEADPTPSNAEALRRHLIEAGIEHDDAIVALARQLLKDTGPAAFGPGSVAATILTQINQRGGSGFVGGEHVHHHGSHTPPSARWTVFRIGTGVLFELQNIGDGSAHNLEMTANFPFRWSGEEPTFIAPNRSKTFIYGRREDFRVDRDPEIRWYGPVPVVKVSWTNTPSRADSQYWEGNLPHYLSLD